MCGIVGVICKKGVLAEVYRERVNAALKQIRHRGPDGKGIYSDENIILGHVRLSIIDLTDAGHQPMSISDGNLIISYNGEVYNFKELKQELSGLGISYKSNTDTEVILEYFKSHGIAGFKKLNGMFAFSITDKSNGTSYLVRDRFGIKPLYYYTDMNKVVFGSEIKAIKTIVDAIEINEKALPEWSYYGNPLGENTLHKNIKQLLPGHYIEINTNTLEMVQNKYWVPESINTLPKNKVNDRSSIIKKTRSLLEKAVCRQLVGDVPVGVFLSGGVDSSAITAFAARNYGNQIDTFSVGFDFEKEKSELSKAALVAKQFNTNHHELMISGYDIVDVVQKMVFHHDSPFSDAANIPLYLLGQEVQGKVKVVLQGDGGDEIFAGYRRYSTLSNRVLWKPFVNSARVLHSKLARRNKAFYSRVRYLNALCSDDDAELMALMLTVEDKYCSPLNIFSEELHSQIKHLDAFSYYRECNNRFLNKNIVQRMLFTDTQTILPNVFLEKVDRSTMAASIEVRVPFLDNDLSTYVMSLPSEIKVKHGQKKWLLKKAMEEILPHDILYAKKTGFGVPYHLWLKGPLNELFNDKIAQLKRNRCTILDWQYIDILQHENLSGYRDHRFLLWKILNLMIWLSFREG